MQARLLPHCNLLVNGIRVVATSRSGMELSLIRKSVLNDNVVEFGNFVIQNVFGAHVNATLVKVD